MEYDKEFEEEWKYSTNWLTHMEKEYAWEVWQASRRDRYRIGEEVQIDCRSGGQDWERGLVGAITAMIGSGFVDKADRIRRWPAWTPKYGDVVFIKKSRDVLVAKVITIGDNGIVYIKHQNGDDDAVRMEIIKPFSADNIGKQWSEI